MIINEQEIIVSTYGPETTNAVPDAAKFGGASVPAAEFGNGTQPAPAVDEATAARHDIALYPRMRDQR